MTDVFADRVRDPRHLTTERVPLDALTRYPDNPRRSGLPDLIESIRQHDFYTVVTAQLATRHVLVGNHRFDAQLAAHDHASHGHPGWTHYAPEHFATVDTKWLDVDDDEARRVNLIDNPLGEAGTYDWQVLRDSLASLLGTDLALAGTGWTESDLEMLGRRLDVPDFDAIEARFGTHEDTATSLWPRWSIVVEPDVMNAWVARWSELPGDDDTARVRALLERPA